MGDRYAGVKRCTGCGAFFPKRSLTGIGSVYSMAWLCAQCVLAGKAEDALRGVSRDIKRDVADMQRHIKRHDHS